MPNSTARNELLIIPQAVQQHVYTCSGKCFSIEVSIEQNSHVGMPHRLLNVQMFQHESFK